MNMMCSILYTNHACFSKAKASGSKIIIDKLLWCELSFACPFIEGTSQYQYSAIHEQLTITSIPFFPAQGTLGAVHLPGPNCSKHW